MTIPLARPFIGAEERDAVDRVLRSGMLVQGPEVAAFEEEFSELVGGRICVAVGSGTTALHLGLLAAGIGAGDEVILPSFSFAASANAVCLCGADPVFVDIDPITYCLDPDAVTAALSPRTAAIMAVHLYGHPAAMDQLQTIAQQAGVLLVEDAAQAHGATFGGRPVGSFGRVAAFSFYPSKNMTTGEGGMVVTDDPGLARTVRLLRNQGMEQRYQNEVVGFNARLTDLAAAIGRVQLRRLPGWNEARRKNAAVLDAGLGGVTTPVCRGDIAHVYHQYTVRATERAPLQAKLDAANIGCGVYYPVPIHRLPAYDLRLDLPHTERAATEVLSLPIHPGLSSADLARIVEVVNG